LINLSIENSVFVAEQAGAVKSFLKSWGTMWNHSPKCFRDSMEILCGLQKNYLLRIGSTKLITVWQSLSQKLLHIL